MFHSVFSGSSLKRSGAGARVSKSGQGSVLIGFVALLFALVLIATPPLALLAQAREKSVPAPPPLPVETRFA